MLTLSPDVQRRETLLNHSCVLKEDPSEDPGAASLRHLLRALRRGRQPDEFWKHVQTVIGDLEGAGRAIYRKVVPGNSPPRTFLIWHHGEQAPNPDSRVTLSTDRDALGLNRVRVDWRLTEMGKRTVRRAQELLAEEVGRAGLGRIQVGMDDDDQAWTKLGTTRMHENPRQGVVDPHCRVHSVSNLYIAGSSVFPTTGYANPTLTIVALAVRLADRIKKVMT